MSMSARSLALATSLFGSLSGCIIYDGTGTCGPPWKDGWEKDSGGAGAEDSGAGGQDGQDSAVEEEPALSWSLSPAQGSPGQTLILSLQASGGLSYGNIEEIWFLGDLTVCTMEARSEELLMTVTIAELAKEGAVDLVVEMADGDSYLLEQVFLVLPAEASEGAPAEEEPVEEEPEDTGAGEEPAEEEAPGGCG
jgi:hypothetical protein